MKTATERYVYGLVAMEPESLYHQVQWEWAALRSNSSNAFV